MKIRIVSTCTKVTLDQETWLHTDGESEKRKTKDEADIA